MNVDQTKCLVSESGAGAKYMYIYDGLSPLVKRRLQESSENLCLACLQTAAHRCGDVYDERTWLDVIEQFEKGVLPRGNQFWSYGDFGPSGRGPLGGEQEARFRQLYATSDYSASYLDGPVFGQVRGPRDFADGGIFGRVDWRRIDAICRDAERLDRESEQEAWINEAIKNGLKKYRRKGECL